MPVSYIDFFNLDKNFTLKELKQSRDIKINSLNKLNISKQDIKFFTEQINNLYNEAKFDLAHGALFMPFDSFITETEKKLKASDNNMDQFNSYSFISSYQSITNSDGSQIVIEKNKTSKNGKVDEKINSYKINSSGSKTIITLDEALCVFNKTPNIIRKKIDYNM